MVELQSSKLAMWVRFPSPAPMSPDFARQGVATGLLTFAAQTLHKEGIGEFAVRHAAAPAAWPVLDGLLKKALFLQQGQEDAFYECASSVDAAMFSNPHRHAMNLGISTVFSVARNYVNNFNSNVLF